MTQFAIARLKDCCGTATCTCWIRVMGVMATEVKSASTIPPNGIISLLGKFGVGW